MQNIIFTPTKYVPRLKHTHHQQKFLQLREEYPFFEYQNYTFTEEADGFRIHFNFNLANKFSFSPETYIPKKSFIQLPENESHLRWLVFHIGMVELISYWKASCSPLVIIRCFQLDDLQIAWWKKLYFNGLGEFFYTNNIQISQENFMDLRCDSSRKGKAVKTELMPVTIVPVGGGKDSAVTIELLKQAGVNVLPFIVNPRKASLDTVKAAGIAEEQTIIFQRTIDPQLLRLNQSGFLNGHTPFSALLAFQSALAALLTGAADLALSNESSASESTVHGENINHQYSKSIEFEQDFRWYSETYLFKSLNYFSFLRPLSELQIAWLFSRFDHYHQVFKSCNVGSKTDSWCCACPKCLFTYLILSPFLPSDRMVKIFGKNLLQEPVLSPVMKELQGKTASKPFECVGTVDEVNFSISLLSSKYRPDELPILLKQATDTHHSAASLQNTLETLNNQHNLDDQYLRIILDAIRN